MNKKAQYAMPADEDDEDVVEDGEEMVDMQDSNEDEGVDNYESEPDQNQDGDGFQNGEDEEAREVVDNLIGGQMDSDDSDPEAENKRPNGQINGQRQLNANHAYAMDNAYANKHQQPQGFVQNVQNGRMRPQSAKTAPSAEQFRFQQMQQNQGNPNQHVMNNQQFNWMQQNQKMTP